MRTLPSPPFAYEVRLHMRTLPSPPFAYEVKLHMRNLPSPPFARGNRTSRLVRRGLRVTGCCQRPTAYVEFSVPLHAAWLYPPLSHPHPPPPPSSTQLDSARLDLTRIDSARPGLRHPCSAAWRWCLALPAPYCCTIYPQHGADAYLVESYPCRKS